MYLTVGTSSLTSSVPLGKLFQKAFLGGIVIVFVFLTFLCSSEKKCSFLWKNLPHGVWAGPIMSTFQETPRRRTCKWFRRGHMTQLTETIQNPPWTDALVKPISSTKAVSWLLNRNRMELEKGLIHLGIPRCLRKINREQWNDDTLRSRRKRGFKKSFLVFF